MQTYLTYATVRHCLTMVCLLAMTTEGLAFVSLQTFNTQLLLLDNSSPVEVLDLLRDELCVCDNWPHEVNDAAHAHLPEAIRVEVQ